MNKHTRPLIALALAISITAGSPAISADDPPDFQHALTDSEKKVDRQIVTSRVHHQPLADQYIPADYYRPGQTFNLLDPWGHNMKAKIETYAYPQMAGPAKFIVLDDSQGHLPDSAVINASLRAFITPAHRTLRMHIYLITDMNGAPIWAEPHIVNISPQNEKTHNILNSLGNTP